jgi:phospholipid/cholesterol/gamma-HCH transport system substrate-binding protein
MKKASLELRVGIFVVAALLGLFILVFKAGDFYLKPGYTMRFLFDFVSGVDKGTPVRLAGVNVGEIKDVHVIRTEDNKTQVELSAWIAQGAFIEEDAEVRINSMGLLGEKYVEILPGTNSQKPISSGGVLIGKTPVVLEKITESGNRLINKMEYTVDNINEVLADPQFKASVRGTFTDAEIVAKNLVETSEDLKDTMKSARIVMGRLRDGEGSIGRLLKDEAMARDLEGFARDIKAHPWRLLKRD